MQSGSSQRSLGDSIKFVCFSLVWWEMASASRQGERMTTYCSKREETFFIAHEKVLAQDTKRTHFCVFLKKTKEEKQNS